LTDENLDEKTASAVNILQQIFGFSQNSTVTQEVVDGSSVMTVNPETIIVEQVTRMTVIKRSGFQGIRSGISVISMKTMFLTIM